MYSSRWGESIHRVLMTYSSMPLQIKGIEILIKTAEDQAIASAASVQAHQVCEGIHVTPPTGLKCLSCYEVEMGMRAEQSLHEEIARDSTEFPESPLIPASLVDPE